MRSHSNTCLAKSSGALWPSRSASTRPQDVLITFGVPKATSDNFAFLAQVELIRSCDAPESNNMMIGRLLGKNVPTRISLPW
jgi:hypothetical protein